MDRIFIDSNTIEDLRVHATRNLQDEVTAMSLGGQEVGLTAILGAAVQALEQSNASLAARYVMAFDSIAGSLEGYGLISAAEASALRSDVPSILALYWGSCWAFEESPAQAAAGAH